MPGAALHGAPRIAIDPQAVYLLVLPPLVYIAAFFTPLRTLRANYRTVASLAVGLVIAGALVGPWSRTRWCRE